MASIVKLQGDPDAAYLVVKTLGGELPGSTFSQKVGPLKIPGKAVGEDVKKITTKHYNGQRVHVLLTVKDRKATCTVVPSTAQIIIRELHEIREVKKKGVDKQPVVHNGSISLNTLFAIAAEIKDSSRSKTLRGTVKEVLGTARSVKCFIDGKTPKEVTDAVNEGRSAVAELFGIADVSSLPAFLDE